jgi:hypothetical protein
MNDHSPPPMGHNNPPSHVDRQSDVLAPFAAYLNEAEHWLDGILVETEQQLEAVDALLFNVKAAEKALSEARDGETRPLHDAWKAEVARWRAPLAEVERLKKGLARISNDFKVRLVEEREAEARRIRIDAERMMRTAQELAKAVEPGNIHSVRVADQARRDAEEAQRSAKSAEKSRPKGVRTVRRWAFVDGEGRRQALHWIARNDRDAVTEFIEGYVGRNFRNKSIEGVRVWDEREAY